MSACQRELLHLEVLICVPRASLPGSHADRAAIETQTCPVTAPTLGPGTVLLVQPGEPSQGSQDHTASIQPEVPRAPPYCK